MKYNLICDGIKSEGAIENTENVVNKFLVDELSIPEAEVSIGLVKGRMERSEVS
jgi:hypothetical protein